MLAGASLRLNSAIYGTSPTKFSHAAFPASRKSCSGVPPCWFRRSISSFVKSESVNASLSRISPPMISGARKMPQSDISAICSGFVKFV